jgi:hypothetical protein
MINFKRVNVNRIKYGNFLYKKQKDRMIHFPKIKIITNINIFKQCSPIVEKQHSNILGTLLNPNGSHGYGTTFLALFFETVLEDTAFFTDSDKWNITIEKGGHYDVRIRNQNNRKIIIIENKSNWAQDQQNQLYRYW